MSSDSAPETADVPAPSLAAVQDELETILCRLEDDSTGLEESIALYEKGSKLLAQAQQVLSAAEQRVRVLADAADDDSRDDS